MSSGRSGRSGTGNWRYRKNRAILLAHTDLCALCGHNGAATADHIISSKDWPRDAYGHKLPGFDDLTNLQPAHGTIGNIGLNPCPQGCGLCNQIRGAKQLHSPRSRQW